MSLNTDQQTAFNEVGKFLESDDKVISISGGAGTGKSYLIGYLKSEYPEILLTATTNEASGLIKGLTIHKYLGFGIRQHKEYEGKYIRGRPILIDEASMLPVYIMAYLLGLGEKIILCGDSNQLTVGYTVNLKDYPTIELKQNMRAKNNDIKSLVNHLDECVEELKYPQIEDYTSDNIHYIHNHEDFQDLIKKEKEKYIVLSYRNNIVDKYAEISENSLTCHKSQGKSFPVVFMDARDIIQAHIQRKNKFNNPIDKSTYLRLINVGLSRAMNKIYIFVGEHRSWA